MRIPKTSKLLPLLLLPGLVACDGAVSPLSIDATGELAVQAFLDRNASGELETGVDLPAAGLRVALLRAAGDTAATALTDAAGVARFSALPLGTYRIGVNPAVLGDSLRLVWADTTRVGVTAAEPALVKLPVGYPLVSSQELDSVPSGRLVTTTGVALHAYNAFGDSVLHLRDGAGFLRVVGPPETVTAAAGDSVRITGRVGTVAGRRALTGAAAFRLAGGPSPDPLPLETAVASGADGGVLDAALVEITEARVLSVTALAQGEFRVRVTDGSGPLDVFFDRHAAIRTEDPLVPGVLLDATGILVPRDGVPGEWMLKPRGSLDVRVTIPRVTTREAREMVAGSVVEIHAVALNGIATFGDATVHLADPSGALRAIQVSTAFQFAGDSIRAVGVLAIREGQMVLSQTTITVLGKSTTPPPSHLATEVAATANGGALDAALVEVRSAEVEEITTATGGDLLLKVDDGSGPITVVLDRDTGIGSAGLAVGDSADFVGVLVPTGTGSWQLRPRTPGDVRKR